MLENCRYELIPLGNDELENFVNSIFSNKQIEEIKIEADKVKPFWYLTNTQQKILFFDKAHSILFGKLYPRPFCSMYSFKGKSTKALFYQGKCAGSWFSNKWEIKFNEQILTESHFEKAFGVWLHESFHGFLDYLSLIVFPSIATEYFRPPFQIVQSSRLIDLNYEDNLTAWRLARKNLLASIDREFFSIDSYYLNLEISVDSLAQLTFRRIYPLLNYQRGYEEAFSYIERRLKGEFPQDAAIYSSSYEVKSLDQKLYKHISKIENTRPESKQGTAESFTTKLNFQNLRWR